MRRFNSHALNYPNIKFFCFGDSSIVKPEDVVPSLFNGTAYIYRDYHLCKTKLLKQIVATRQICKANKVAFFVAKDVALINKVKADGFHCPQFMLNKIPSIRAKFPNLAISAACHNLNSVNRAVKLGADYIFISPVFKTLSHKAVKPIGTTKLGLVIYRNIISGPGLITPLGGIGEKEIKRLKMHKTKAVAGISLFSAN